jgi:hypothetical protein
MRGVVFLLMAEQARKIAMSLAIVHETREIDVLHLIVRNQILGERLERAFGDLFFLNRTPARSSKICHKQ